MKKTLVTTLIASGIALATLSGAAHAKGRLVVYCSATNEMCEAETKAFGEKYDVKNLVYSQRLRQHAGEGRCREEKPAGGCLVRRHPRPAVPGRRNGPAAAL